MTKLYTREVTTCCSCPNFYTPTQDSRYWPGLAWYCKAAMVEGDYAQIHRDGKSPWEGEFPGFCPLPDAEEREG